MIKVTRCKNSYYFSKSKKLSTNTLISWIKNNHVVDINQNSTVTVGRKPLS